MSKYRYVVEIERLAAEVCPEIVEEFDGIRYRARVTEATARSFRGQLLEPFVQSFYMELPLFVLGFTSFRMVRDGQPTAELERELRRMMEGAHRASIQEAGLKVAMSIDSPRLERVFAEAKARLAALAAEERDLRSRLEGPNLLIDKAQSQIRREIQKGVKERRIDQGEGLKMLMDHRAIEAAAAALVPNGPKESDVARLNEIQPEMDQVAEVFCADTGFSLKEVGDYLALCPNRIEPGTKAPIPEES